MPRNNSDFHGSRENQVIFRKGDVQGKEELERRAFGAWARSSDSSSGSMERFRKDVESGKEGARTAVIYNATPDEMPVLSGGGPVSGDDLARERAKRGR